MVEGLGRMSMIEVVERMIPRSCCRSIQDISVLGTSAAQTAPLRDNPQPSVVSPSFRAPDSRDSLPGRVGQGSRSSCCADQPADGGYLCPNRSAFRNGGTVDCDV